MLSCLNRSSNADSSIGASVALAFIGLTNTSVWSLGTILYWAQSQEALQLGAWWWILPPGLVVALMAWLAQRQIAGQTGDVLGALEQVSEIAVLLVALG